MRGVSPQPMGEREKGRFRRLWESGMPNAEIARHFGRETKSWASNMASRLGLPGRSNGRDALRGVDVSEFQRLWDSGIPTIDIAQHFGRNHATWSTRVAGRLGLPARLNVNSRESILSEVDEGKFGRLWRSGMPLIEISRQFGRSSSSWASKTASRLGLEVRPNSRRGITRRRDIDASRVIRLRAEGLPLTAIAAVLVCDVQVVRNCLDSMDMSANGPNDPKYAREDD